MNITTPATVPPAGGTAAQPRVGVETKGIFVPRKGSLRRFCCRNDVCPEQAASQPTALTSRTHSHAKPVDPPTIAEVQVNPEQASFLGWLEKTHAISTHQLISQYLTDNEGAFARAADEHFTPNNFEAIFEALCRQMLQ